MEESRKNDQETQELSPETLEQVSGGAASPTKTKFCSNCRDTTTWIFLDGVWICGKCGRGASGAPLIV